MTKRWRLFFWFFLGTAGTALFLAVLYALLAGAQSSKSADETVQLVRDSQVANHTLLDKIVVLSHQINDCTQTNGKCHREGQRQTAEAVGSIGQEAIVRSACGIVISHESSESRTPLALAQQIQSCVTQTLAQLDHERANR